MRPPTLLAALLTLTFAPFVVAVRASTPAPANILLAYDFDTPASQWMELYADSSGPTVFADAMWGPVPGVAATAASPGLIVTMDTTAGNTAWETFVLSGPLAVKNTETSLARLSLAFSLSTSSALPVIIRLESLDASRNRTGGIERRVHPGAPATVERHIVMLDTFKPFGEGSFDPAAPFVQLILATDQAWPASTDHRLTLDDVRYATQSAPSAPAP